MVNKIVRDSELLNEAIQVLRDALYGYDIDKGATLSLLEELLVAYEETSGQIHEVDSLLPDLQEMINVEEKNIDQPLTAMQGITN